MKISDNDQMRIVVKIFAHQPLKAKSVQSFQRPLSIAKCQETKKQGNSWGKKRELHYKIWFRKNDCMISIQLQNVHKDYSHNYKIIFYIIFPKPDPSLFGGSFDFFILILLFSSLNKMILL